MARGLPSNSFPKLFLLGIFLLGFAFQEGYSQSYLPSVAFAEASITSSEGNSVAEISVELVESNNTAVDVEVLFLSNSSTVSNGNDIANYTTQTVSFSDQDSSGASKTVAIGLIEDEEFEGSEKAVFQLQNASAGTIIDPDVATLTIRDNDAPDIVINEILYDPTGAGDTNGGKFVELVNNSDSEADISNWTLSDDSNTRYTFPAGTVIPAKKAFVVFENSAGGTGFGGAYLYSSGSLGLNQTGDRVILKDNRGNEVANVSYTGSESEESMTRNADITGSFEGHKSADSDNSLPSSPGTKVDGTAFGSKYAVGLRGSAGWRMISTPSKNTSFNDLLGDIWIQGIPGSDDDGAGFSNIVGWNEAEKKFTYPTSLDENMVPGRGYAVYVYEDDDARAEGIQGGFPKVINTNNTDATENDENRSSVRVNVTANDADQSGAIDGPEEGWNLLGNPFGTDISVDALFAALKNTNKNVNANIAVWDHDKPGGPGYIYLQEGDQERLGPFQAFWVRFETVGTDADVTLDKDDLSANYDANFIKSAANNEFQFQLNLHGEQDYFDTFSVAFSENGATDLNRFDAYQLPSLDVNSINLYSIISNNRITSKELPVELETTMEFPLSYSANGSDQLTFQWDIHTDIPDNWNLRLMDKETGQEINMRNVREYTFRNNSSNKSKLSDNNLLNRDSGEEGNPRFVLSIDPNIQSENNSALPESIKLNPNYPNPFNPTTTIPYEITEDAEVRLTVWNMIGQKVATLVDGNVEAGTHEVTWNAQRMPSGIYIARFEVNGNVFTRKMTLIK